MPSRIVLKLKRKRCLYLKAHASKTLSSALSAEVEDN
jgi:hypothetical protein